MAKNSLLLVGRYIVNILYWIDEGVNVILGGDPRETLSSRMGKTNKCQVCNWICKGLHLIDPRHCKRNVDQYVGSRSIWKWL